VTFNSTSSPTTITVNASAAPTVTPPPTTACTIAVTGASGQSATVNVNIQSTGVVISGKKKQGTDVQATALPHAAPQPGASTSVRPPLPF
jgi:hypothetical protein